MLKSCQVLYGVTPLVADDTMVAIYVPATESPIRAAEIASSNAGGAADTIVPGCPQSVITESPTRALGTPSIRADVAADTIVPPIGIGES